MLDFKKKNKEIVGIKWLHEQLCIDLYKKQAIFSSFSI